MSLALTIEKVDGQMIGRELPISTNALYLKYWEPIVRTERLPWLELLLSPGFASMEEELPELVAEVRRLKAAVPHYYSPGNIGYQHLEERLTSLLAEPETLAGKKVALFFG